MKTYYHVSPIAGITTLQPRVPVDVDGECDTPRVCVCPSIALAYDASGCERYPTGTRIHVYAIDNRVPDINPQMAMELGTLDACDMCEHWYTEPVPCELIETDTIP